MDAWPPPAAAREPGSIFLDARGGDRALRVSWHHETDLVVLSLWRDNVCAGSFRLAVDEVPELIAMLRRASTGVRGTAPTAREPAPDAPARRNLRNPLETPDTVRSHGPDPEPLRPRRRPAPARAGRPRRAAAAPSTSCSSGSPAAARSARIVLTGLRGVGKTVLLNALRSAAVRADWGTGKLEARPDQPLRRPLSRPLHQAVRELGHPQADDVDHVLGVDQGVRRSASAGAGRQAARPVAARHRRSRPSRGRADSGDIEIDLVELLTDVGGLAADVGKGVAIFIDEMQDLGPDDVSALCAACHEIASRACR